MVQFQWSDRIELTEQNVKAVPENKAGVYRLTTRNKDTGVHTVFYVGKSEDLRNRLMEHMSDNEENECVKEKVKNYRVWFRIAYSLSAADRENAEYTMYHHFKPSCNKVESSGKTIDMNFD